MEPATIKGALLSEKRLWFNLHDSGPSFTFQYVFWNPFHDSSFFLFFLKGIIQQLRNAKNDFFNLTHSYVKTCRIKRFVINAS